MTTFVRYKLQFSMTKKNKAIRLTAAQKMIQGLMNK